MNVVLNKANLIYIFKKKSWLAILHHTFRVTTTLLILWGWDRMQRIGFIRLIQAFLVLEILGWKCLKITWCPGLDLPPSQLVSRYVRLTANGLSSTSLWLMGTANVMVKRRWRDRGRGGRGGSSWRPPLFNFMPSAIIVLSRVILAANLHFARVKTYF